ncbi:MAG: cell division protein FtsQ/DivIB [Bacteroidales bacterium]
MKKHILYMTLFVLLVLFIGLSSFRINGMYSKATLEYVSVKNNNDIRFVADSYIIDKVENSPIVKGVKFEDINLDSLENYLAKNHLLDDVDVIKTYSFEKGKMSGVIGVSLTQRRPILRVKTASDDFFMDENGVRMNKSASFTSNVLLASGSVTEIFARDVLVPFVKTLKNSEFWSSQIVQIYVHDSKDIGLVMLYGSQLVVIGDTSDVKEKLNNLWAFYHDPVAASKMSKYRVINLKYKGQIVCSE